MQCAGGAGGFRAKQFRHFHRAASKTRRGGGAEGRWRTDIFEEQKKSNAYFGKSLVRLACNKEKNTENFREKNEHKEKLTAGVTAESVNRRVEPSSSDGTRYQMACGSASEE